MIIEILRILSKKTNLKHIGCDSLITNTFILGHSSCNVKEIPHNLECFGFYNPKLENLPAYSPHFLGFQPSGMEGPFMSKKSIWQTEDDGRV